MNNPQEAAVDDHDINDNGSGGDTTGIFKNNNSSGSSKDTNNTNVATTSTTLSRSSSFWIRSPHEHDEKNAGSSSSSNSNINSSYRKVLWDHPQYRAYVASHICMHIGDWFVRIANLIAVAKLARLSDDGEGDASETGKAISFMVLCRLLPHLGFAQVGGVLADVYDRRHLMIVLDLCAGCVVLLYPLLALRYNSLPMLYTLTAIRATISAIYYPITTAIVPVLVQNQPSAIKFALTINGMVWSITAILGGLIAGVLISVIGLNGCYYVDFVTFWLSAMVMYMWTSGSYRARQTSNYDDHEVLTDTPATESVTGEKNSGCKNPVTRCCHNSFINFRDLSLYLFTCGFGVMVFSRASGSLVWGMEDIIISEFSVVYDDEDGTELPESESESESAMRMGQLYSVMGGGFLIGPLLSNLLTNSHFPHTYQMACLVGLAGITTGWLITSFMDEEKNFVIILIGTFVRTMGSGTIWMNSTLILQTLAVPTFLGRIIAVDYMLTTLMEATSAGTAGLLFSEADSNTGFDGRKLSLFGAILGSVMFVLWSFLYYFRIGAANPKFNQVRNSTTKPVFTIDDDDDDDFVKGSIDHQNDTDERTMMMKSNTDLSQDC